MKRSTKTHRLAATLALVLMAAAGPASAANYPDVNDALVDRVALPAYRALAAQAEALVVATKALCDVPGADKLSAMRAQLSMTMDAWQRAQPLAFGPVTWQARASRIQFWPDKRGTARRQLQGALAKADPSLLDADGLVGRSVALQNLASFEMLAFEQPVDTAEGAYACKLALAIARYQAALSARLLADWEGEDGYAAQVHTAVLGNDTFDTPRQPANDFYRTMVGTLDVVARNKLERPLGMGADATRPDPRPKRLESWRSGQSRQNIAANLTTVAAVYDGLSPLVAEREPALDTEVRARLAKVRALVSADGRPLRDALTDEAGAAAAAKLLTAVRELRTQLAGPVAKVTGLGVGFNSADGD